MHTEMSPHVLAPTQCQGPPIPVVPAGIARPLWSVMIPTYNCAVFLRETLCSVLAQDPGPSRMQIEVIDDCSTRDDPEAVVQEVGRGRVAFYRQPKNGGAIHNFNTCIRRAQGKWVHILHGDDLVEPSFYWHMGELAKKHPEASFLAARCYQIDEDGILECVTPRVPQFEELSTDPRPILLENVFRTPAMVVCRSFYEAHGGFLEPLVHTADWEMWVRAISNGGIAMLNRPLARYRAFRDNDTSRLARTGENLRDYLRLASVFAQKCDGFDQDFFKVIVWSMARRQIKLFRKLGDVEAVAANRQVFEEIEGMDLSMAWRLKRFVGAIPIAGPVAIAIKKRLFDRFPSRAEPAAARRQP